MPSFAVVRSVDPGTGAVSGIETISCSALYTVSETIGIGTDTQVAFTCDVSAAKVFFIKCSTAATIETNATNGSVNVFTMAAGVPFLYTSTQGGSFRDTAGTAVSTDITTLYVTNVASTDLTIIVGTDATP